MTGNCRALLAAWVRSVLRAESRKTNGFRFEVKVLAAAFAPSAIHGAVVKVPGCSGLKQGPHGLGRPTEQPSGELRLIFARSWELRE
jgi:hypothetical protein